MAILFLDWEMQAIAYLVQNKLVTHEQMTISAVINRTLPESLINNFYLHQIWEFFQKSP